MLILTDLYMPYMNGVELAEEIHKIFDNKKFGKKVTQDQKIIRVFLLTADEPSDELKTSGTFNEI